MVENFNHQSGINLQSFVDRSVGNVLAESKNSNQTKIESAQGGQTMADETIIRLTDEQKKQLKEATGQEHEEFKVETLGSVLTPRVAPRRVQPRKAAPKMALAKKSAPKMALAKKSAPKMALAKKSAPKMALAKKSAPKMALAKKSAPKMALAKKSAPKMALAKKAAPKQIAPKKGAI